MSGSKTTIADEDRLDNVHPGDILREDFLIGTEVPLDEVSAGTGIDATRLKKVLSSKLDIDAALDAPTRVFGAVLTNVTIVSGKHHVDIRIAATCPRPGADGNENAVAVGTIDEVMTVG